MSHRRRLAILLLALISAVGAAPGPAADSSKIKVGRSVHVSAAEPDSPHAELLVAADPADPKRLLACSMVLGADTGTWTIVGYSSFDGGGSWRRTLRAEHGPNTGDPACAFGPEGAAYLAALGGDTTIEGQDEFYTYVYRSLDGGASWGKPVRLPHTDREYLTVDNTRGKYRGRVYLNATGLVKALDDATQYGENFRVGVAISHSDDGGLTFQPPVKVVSSGDRYVLGMGNSVVLSDGTLVTLFGEQRDRKVLDESRPKRPNADLKVIVSPNGGEQFAKAVTVSDWHMNYGEVSLTGSVVPVLAVDSSPGPFTDRLYTVWPDLRSGRSEILLSYSTDKGKSWSPPLVVNDDRPFPGHAPGPDNGLPVVSVNSRGIVGVAWYDRRDHPGNLGWSVRFAMSEDGGETFSPSARVSDGAYDPSRGDRIVLNGSVVGGAERSEFSKGTAIQIRLGPSPFFLNGGDTGGMTADSNGNFHPFWIDNRSGTPQIWTALVTVNASALEDSGMAGSGLTDVSGRLTLVLGAPRLEKRTNTISMDVALKNTSTDTVTGPIRLKLLSVRSVLGRPEVVGGDAADSRALWDFTPFLEDGRLEPGRQSKPKKVTFRLLDAPTWTPPTTWRDLAWLEISARAFGKSERSRPAD